MSRHDEGRIMDHHADHSPRRGDRHRGAGAGALLHDIIEPLRAGRAALRRGNVRLLILAVLRDQPMHGYQVIQELEARTGGRWRPSAGSIYPTLQQLEDEGLLSAKEVDGRKTYALTTYGQTAAAENPLARHPWFHAADGGEMADLRRLGVQLIGAALQVRKMGSVEAQRQARDILIDSRRRMYRLLADDEGDETQGGAAS
jgi:DNA-binding PadR family transcriptional regulator